MSSMDFGGIDGLRTLRPMPEPQGPAGLDESDVVLGSDGDRRPESFSAILGRSLQDVQRLQNDVREQYSALARGEPVELHDILIAQGKSSVAFNMLLEVRNKLVDAWQTLSRSSV